MTYLFSINRQFAQFRGKLEQLFYLVLVSEHAFLKKVLTQECVRGILSS